MGIREEESEDVKVLERDILERFTEGVLEFKVLSQTLIDHGCPAHVITTSEGTFLITCRKISHASIPKPSAD